MAGSYAAAFIARMAEYMPRFVLVSPWMELNGSVSLVCSESMISDMSTFRMASLGITGLVSPRAAREPMSAMEKKNITIPMIRNPSIDARVNFTKSFIA